MIPWIKVLPSSLRHGEQTRKFALLGLKSGIVLEKVSQ